MPSPDGWLVKIHVKREENMVQGQSKVPLCNEILCEAYRLHTPCCGHHNSINSRTRNCSVSPWCLMGFGSMSEDEATLCQDMANAFRDEFLISSDYPLGSLPQSSSGTSRKESPADALTFSAVPTPRRGIANLGNTCYLSVIVQLLFDIPEVRNGILRMCFTPEAASDANEGTHLLAASGLGELFAEMAFSRNEAGADASKFASYLSIDTTEQHDAQEFFAELINRLKHKAGDLMQRVFEGTIVYDRGCRNCGLSIVREEPFSFLSLPVKPTLEEALDTFLSAEEVAGFKCDKCGATTTAFSCQYIKTLPEVIIIHLNRFTFDADTFQSRKLSCGVNFPLAWDFTSYINNLERGRKELPSPHGCRKARGRERFSCERQEYTLMGVVNHLGDSAECGHYTYYGNVGGADDWYVFDNAMVKKLNRRFRGHRSSSNEAYMLVYKRLSTPEGAGACARNLTSPPSAAVSHSEASHSSIVLPPQLVGHLERLNSNTEARWLLTESKHADAASFLRLWNAVVESVFNQGDLEVGAQSRGMTGDINLADFVAFPSSWLELLGRRLPHSLSSARNYAGTERRRKRCRDAGSSGLECLTPLKASGAADLFTESSDSVSSADAASSAPTCEERDAMETVTRAQVLLMARFSEAAVAEHFNDIRCPHGKLAPWSSYKLISVQAARKVGELLSAFASLGSLPATSWLSSFSGWHLCDYTCDACVRAMSEEVIVLKNRWNEEREFHSILLKRHGKVEGIQSDVPIVVYDDEEEERQDDDHNEEDSEEQVYVGVCIVDYWMRVFEANARKKDVVCRQGFTGLLASNMVAPAGKVYETVVTLPPSVLLTCEHNHLAPDAVVRILPISVWCYLRERVTELLQENDGIGFEGVMSAQAICERVENLLPYLPIDRVLKCPQCSGDVFDTERKQDISRVKGEVEGDLFPTLMEASRHGHLPIEERCARHPNWTVWSRSLQCSKTHHGSLWEGVDAEQTFGVNVDGSVSSENCTELSQPNSHCSRASSINLIGVRSNRIREAAKAPLSSPALLPFTDTIVLPCIRRLTGDPRHGPLEGCRETNLIYGCVPMWWVAQWRQWCTDTSRGSSPPPLLDHRALFCRHGGTVLTPELLNPANTIWKRQCSASHLKRAWRKVVPCFPPIAFGSAGRTRSCDADEDVFGVPPVLLVPLEEFVRIVKRYGVKDMLLQSNSAAGDVSKHINTSCVVLFKRHNTEYAFDPPSCEICATRLLALMKEMSRNFFNGTLQIRLHIRVSNTSFYDAEDVISDVQHDMTIANLKLAISKHVFRVHGYMLPFNEMTLSWAHPRHYHNAMENPAMSATSDSSDAEKGEGIVGFGVNKNTRGCYGTRKGDASTFIIDDDSESSTSASPELDEDGLTLFECGVCDGDTLSVSAVGRVFQKVSDGSNKRCMASGSTAQGALTAPGTTAMRAFSVQCRTQEELRRGSFSRSGGRLHSHKKRPGGLQLMRHNTRAPSQLACRACTFVNPSRRKYCHMCGTPLKKG